MKSIASSLCALLVAAACSGSTAPVNSSSKIVGDYVEARTASVFAGACHYNGELVTVGRDAVAAWNITGGSWKGTDLAGVKAMAAIASEANLGDEHAARKVELVIDTHASKAQAAAVTALIGEKCGAKLGQIVSVRRASIAFSHVERQFKVTAEGFASLAIEAMPNDECCAQPNLVWYAPLAPIEHRKVGFTNVATYTAGTVGDRWRHEGENSAFYGSFSF